MLYLRCARHRTAHPDHSEQLRRLLQGANAQGKSAETKRRAAQSSTQRQSSLVECAQPVQIRR